MKTSSRSEPSRPEVVGLVLLGIGLLGIALPLRSAQAGLAGGTMPLWPAAAAGLYLVVALVTEGLRLRALMLFATACVTHVVYAYVMGCAFVVARGAAADLPLGPLRAGLLEYPPAVLLQAAFALPLALLLAAPRAHFHAPRCEALDRAQTAEEVLQGVLALEAAAGEDADPVLARVAAKAREVLIGSAGRLETVVSQQAAQETGNAAPEGAEADGASGSEE